MKFTWGLDNKKTTASLKTNYQDTGANDLLTERLRTVFEAVPAVRPIIIICIGTDRSTGDSLGPLVGTLMKKRNISGQPIYGTLDHPVHAMNLIDTLKHIDCLYTNPFIVAIDACLGQHANIGMIHIGHGPMKPGAGVNKDLPPVGDIHITGVVNVGGFMEFMVLQNTRLSLVMDMAEIISKSLLHSLPLRHDLGTYSALNL
jgi:putative sporulation protein YyaC